MSVRIGYFIPEFPGQTHVFLWRERQALQDLGIKADLVSTRLPPPEIDPHGWSLAARQETSFLLPFSIRDLWETLLYLARLDLAHWRLLGSTLRKAETASLMGRMRLIAMLLPAAKLGQIAHRLRWTHLHVHSCGDAANLAVLCWAMCDLPYSLTLHGPTLELYGANQKQKWEHSRFATVVSKKLFEHVVHRLSLTPATRVGVAAMGVDLECLFRTRPYHAWSPGQPCRLFSCGRLNPVKGHEDLLGAVTVLTEAGIEVSLRIAGEDEQGGTGYRRRLEDAISKAGLKHCVTLLGAVNEEQIRQELEDAHVFVLASHNEGISVAIMEAMAMELPVVVTDVGGNHELVEHEVDGLLVQDSQPAQMARMIRRVIEDKKLGAAMRAASRGKIARQFTHRASAAAIAQALRRTEAKASPAPNSFAVVSVKTSASSS
ncbi:MAG: exopolysaccharide biosynthesis GT4 family glycosyltransferase EpsE [Pseudorhizobium sp.]